MFITDKGLEEFDPELWQSISKESVRQEEHIELIASENYTSKGILEIQGSVLTNKYAEGYPGKRYYGGCENVDVAESLAIERAKKLYGAAYANVQPHSGASANSAVFLALCNAGDTILGMSLDHGGHLTHGAKVNFSGKTYNSFQYGLDPKTGELNYQEVEDLAKEHNPKLIIAGFSAYSGIVDWAKFREIADSVNAYLLVDMAHVSGLVAAKEYPSPIPHADVVTTTTHKTLRGARGGLIMIGKDYENPFGLKFKNGNLKMMSKLVDLAVFPGNQGGPLEHVIAAKAVGFGEALDDSFYNYIERVKNNASTMCNEFISRGYNVVSNGTDNHLMLIDLRNKNITGKDAESALVKADITANKNMVPYDDKSPFITSGIRFGTPAITTRGLVESDIKNVVEMIDKVILNHDNESVLREVKKDVNQMMSDRPLFNP